MTEKAPLPSRRQGIRIPIAFEFGGNATRADVQFNIFEDGRICEFFCRPFKSGADIESLLDKFCIVSSIALRHGARIGEIARIAASGGNAPARDLFGAILQAGVKLEQEKMAEIAKGATVPC